MYSRQRNSRLFIICSFGYETILATDFITGMKKLAAPSDHSDLVLFAVSRGTVPLLLQVCGCLILLNLTVSLRTDFAQCASQLFCKISANESTLFVMIKSIRIWENMLVSSFEVHPNLINFLYVFLATSFTKRLPTPSYMTFHRKEGLSSLITLH